MKVLKRKGDIEDYDESKIVRVVSAAGLPDEEAKKLGADVTKEINGLKVETISSLQIRDIVIEKLKEVDQRVADLFIWYQKTKEPKEDQ